MCERLAIDFDIIQYHLWAKVAAAFDILCGRNLLESRTPDASVVLNAAYAFVALPWAWSVGLIAVCHARGFAGQLFRLLEKEDAFCAITDRA